MGYITVQLKWVHFTLLFRMEEWQKGCSPSVLPPTRVLNKHATFVDKYGMELVAGTWFQVKLQLFVVVFVDFCGQVLYEENNKNQLFKVYVAGISQVPYSGRESDKMNCYFSKCTRAPFPAPLPGGSQYFWWFYFFLSSPQA